MNSFLYYFFETHFKCFWSTHFLIHGWMEQSEAVAQTRFHLKAYTSNTVEGFKSRTPFSITVVQIKRMNKLRLRYQSTLMPIGLVLVFSVWESSSIVAVSSLKSRQ